MLLPDCFTASDINAVIHYLCCECDGSLMYAWGCTFEFLLFCLLFLYFVYDCVWWMN